eukprot:CAMPEP_0182498238 /NCGR_PEP_ID=MMETSP1321-20130603/6497_1 /TAXON_ID=91990 /ORGANISM="Bolidomonas sp., Strain RCC1657" /LENGTH=44 /DNA_ID= /DNA_START= /DNA_END= /DNA_ORIENTATION=
MEKRKIAQTPVIMVKTPSTPRRSEMSLIRAIFSIDKFKSFLHSL